MRKFLSYSVLMVGLVSGAWGCEDAVQAPEPAKPAAETETPPADPVQAAEAVEAKPAEEYVRPEYPNSQRRNPFQPDPEIVTPVAKAIEGEVRELEPLEQFALGQLQLVAIISEVAVPTAMFRDPSGFGHFVKEGDRIGRNSGVISDIRENEVEVLEGGDDEDSQTLQRIVRLRDTELVMGDSGLSDEEKAALERLLETEEGRKALQRTFQENAAGANAVEGEAPATDGAIDPRFRGFAPPSEN